MSKLCFAYFRMTIHAEKMGLTLQRKSHWLTVYDATVFLCLYSTSLRKTYSSLLYSCSACPDNKNSDTCKDKVRSFVLHRLPCFTFEDYRNHPHAFPPNWVCNNSGGSKMTKRTKRSLIGQVYWCLHLFFGLRAEIFWRKGSNAPVALASTGFHSMCRWLKGWGLGLVRSGFGEVSDGLCRTGGVQEFPFSAAHVENQTSLRLGHRTCLNIQSWKLGGDGTRMCLNMSTSCCLLVGFSRRLFVEHIS